MPRVRNRPARIQIEGLESRLLLSADPLQVLIGGGAARSVQFNDPNGTAVQVALKGAGTANVTFDGTDLTEAANARGVIVNGSGVTLDTIAASQTSIASTLQITTRGKQDVTVNTISIDGAMGAIKAPAVMATGDISATSWIQSVQLAGAENGTITVGAARSAAAALIANLGSVSNESLASGVSVTSLTASSWINTVGSGQAVTAPSIQAIKITHDATFDLTVGSVGSFTVGGTLANSTIALQTPLAPRGYDLQRLTVGGGILSTMIRSGGNVGAINAAQMQGTDISVGVASLPAGQNLPNSVTDFANVAQITSVTIGRSTAATFVDSDIVAYAIGSLNLGQVLMSNNNTQFGVGTHALKSISLIDQATGRAVHGRNITSQSDFNALLTAKGITPRDFAVLIV